jgi:hypothetical protein
MKFPADAPKAKVLRALQALGFKIVREHQPCARLLTVRGRAVGFPGGVTQSLISDHPSPITSSGSPFPPSLNNLLAMP